MKALESKPGGKYLINFYITVLNGIGIICFSFSGDAIRFGGGGNDQPVKAPV